MPVNFTFPIVSLQLKVGFTETLEPGANGVDCCGAVEGVDRDGGGRDGRQDEKHAKKMPVPTSISSTTFGYGPTAGCVRARSEPLRHVEIPTCRNPHAGASSGGAHLVSPRISSEPENFNQIWC